MKLRKNIAGLALVAALAVGVGLQRQALVRAKAENRDLQAQKGVNSQVPAPQAVHPETEAAPEVMRDLPRLRNEVRELRAQKQEMAKLQTENADLSLRLNQRRVVQQASAPTEAAGFMMNSTWTHAGFGSPEAAVQTFFCALRDSNIVNLVSSITPETARNEGIMDSEGKLYAHAADQALWSMGRIKGYRIVELRPKGDDRASVKVQAAINGESVELPVRRIGLEWKLELD